MPQTNGWLEHFNLHAARALSERVPCSEIFKRKAGVPIPDSADLTWFDDVRSDAVNGTLEENGLGIDEVVVARNYFELESLVRSLDSMETIASSEGLAKE